MKIIDLSKYGPIVSDKEVGNEIYLSLKKGLKDGNSISVDLVGIHSMATFCAKQIFGNLYVELGAKTFFDKILLLNANNDLKAIIQIGIQDAIEENEEI